MPACLYFLLFFLHNGLYVCLSQSFSDILICSVTMSKTWWRGLSRRNQGSLFDTKFARKCYAVCFVCSDFIFLPAHCHLLYPLSFAAFLFYFSWRSLSPWPPEKVMLGQREGGSKADLPIPPSCLQPVIARVAHPSSTPPSQKAHFSRYFLAELFPASSLLLPLQALAMAASCLKGRRSLLKDVRSSPWKLYTPWGNR